jgi:outer membrane protein TolC
VSTRLALTRGAVLTLLVCLVCPLHAQADATPLLPEAVLASSEQHFPQILQRLAAQRAAEGKALEAEGAFDVVFAADGFSRVSGFYDGTAVSGVAKQRLRPLGAELYTGYKISDGDFPVYEDVNFTNTAGAVKVGVLFSLLRDRDIDKARFGETDARLGVREADLELLLTKIGVQQRALVAYWRWVKNGQQLAVYEDLLRIAIERQSGLEEQVRRGARAEINLIENQQNITRRQSLVTAARRDLRVAANALSYYYRGEAGRPVVPKREQLPPDTAISGAASGIPGATPAATSEALMERPELKLLRTAIEREQNRIALTENNLKPRLDLSMEVQRGLGGIAEGGASRDETDTIIGFKFTVPLQQREVRGRLMQARAELEQQRQAERLKSEQIELEVRNIVLELTLAEELQQLAKQEVVQSQTLQAAELQRFESGASDFFLVNVREETAANARIKLLQAQLELRIARANYDAATVDLQRLGITRQ